MPQEHRFETLYSSKLTLRKGTTMRSSTPAVTILVALLTLPCLSNGSLRAEISPLPKLRGIGWRKSLPTHLLGNEAVHREIGLSDDLVQQVNDLRTQLENEAKANPSMRLSRHAQVEAKWNELLTPKQKSRLDEIRLQEARLLDAFSDEEVIKELGGFSVDQ
jgi:hypothetical protein